MSYPKATSGEVLTALMWSVGCFFMMLIFVYVTLSYGYGWEQFGISNGKWVCFNGFVSFIFGCGALGYFVRFHRLLK